MGAERDVAHPSGQVAWGRAPSWVGAGDSAY